MTTQNATHDNDESSRITRRKPYVLRYNSNHINAPAKQRFETRHEAVGELATLRREGGIREGLRFRAPSIDYEPHY